MNDLIIRVVKFPLRPIVHKYNALRNYYLLHRSKYIFLFKNKLFGISWFDYYRRLSSDNVNPDAPLNKARQLYIEQGSAQLKVLIQNGLKKTDTICDFGRGCLRLAHYAIDYLEPNHYFCAAISENRLIQGVRYLNDAGYSRATYSASLIKDLTLNQFKGKKFDFIWTSSFFTHMTRTELKNFLEALKSIITLNTKILFTFSHQIEGMKGELDSSKWVGCNFYYRPKDICHLLDECGYSFTLVEKGFLYDVTSIGLAQLKEL